MPGSEPPSASAVEAQAAAAPSGKLAVLTAFAMAANALPVPFLPDRLVKRVRGALVHDVGARHGVSFTSDARDLLADPGPADWHGLVRAAESVARTLVRRYIGPLGLLSFAASGLEVFAFGLLLERYVRDVRPRGSVRVHLDEARGVRDAIEKAVVRAVSPSLRPALTTQTAGVEDLRDEFTRWVDALLLTSATVPSYVERRLEAAFDEVAAEVGLGRG